VSCDDGLVGSVSCCLSPWCCAAAVTLIVQDASCTEHHHTNTPHTVHTHAVQLTYLHMTANQEDWRRGGEAGGGSHATLKLRQTHQSVTSCLNVLNVRHVTWHVTWRHDDIVGSRSDSQSSSARRGVAWHGAASRQTSWHCHTPMSQQMWLSAAAASPSPTTPFTMTSSQPSLMLLLRRSNNRRQPLTTNVILLGRPMTALYVLLLSFSTVTATVTPVIYNALPTK